MILGPGVASLQPLPKNVNFKRFRILRGPGPGSCGSMQAHMGPYDGRIRTSVVEYTNCAKKTKILLMKYKFGYNKRNDVKTCHLHVQKKKGMM